MFSTEPKRLFTFIILFTLLAAATPRGDLFADCLNDISVTSGDDSGPGTLRQAMIDICPGGTITLQVSAVTLTSDEITIDRDVTILGHGAKLTAIEAAAAPQAGNNRIFAVSEGVLVTLREVTLRHGNAGTEGSGGAMQISPAADVTIEDSALVANRAGEGGGAIFLQSASLTINNSEISENSGSQIGIDTFGGGIRVRSDSGDADLSVSNATVASNFARNGGGISAQVSSGQSITVSLAHCTVAENIVVGGGVARGLFVSADAAASFVLNVDNCIIANGSPGTNFHAEGSGTVTISRTYTLLEDSSLPDGGLNGNIDNADPLLGELRDNGGQTRTHAPLPGGPAHDAGDPGFVAPPIYDQRGSGYPRLLNGRLDMGAHEVSHMLYLPFVTKQ